jgi:hypothetical protein
MALWQRCPDETGRTFFVVTPVHVRESASADDAELCWMMGEVQVDKTAGKDFALTTMREPTNWRILRQFDNPSRDMRGCPIVVHLGGCALFALPSQIDESLVRGGRSVDLVLGPHTRLDHAITVDEYLALRQSEAELLWGSDTKPRGLPETLITGAELVPRYWVSLGVPIGDVAVRHRLLSQLTRQRLAQGRSGDQSAPPTSGMSLGAPPGASTDDISSAARLRQSLVRGVAINTRLGQDETGLLYWTGLDVVNGSRCDEFVDELTHYAEHLRARPELRRSSTTEGCPLP